VEKSVKKNHNERESLCYSLLNYAPSANGMNVVLQCYFMPPSVGWSKNIMASLPKNAAMKRQRREMPPPMIRSAGPPDATHSPRSLEQSWCTIRDPCFAGPPAGQMSGAALFSASLPHAAGAFREERSPYRACCKDAPIMIVYAPGEEVTAVIVTRRTPVRRARIGPGRAGGADSTWRSFLQRGTKRRSRRSGG